MKVIVYLLGGIIALSGLTFFIQPGGYACQAIAAVQIVLAAISLILLISRAIKPLKSLTAVAMQAETGDAVDGSGQKLTKEFSVIFSALKNLSSNADKAISFIKNIEEGKLDIEYTAAENGDNKLGKSLINLRNKLNEIAESEKERNWTTEGLAKFVEILRANNDDLASLADKILRNLVHYLNANQGQLYIVNDDDPAAVHLEMEAFYAFNRKKFMEKRIEIGQGLVGQAYQEQDTILLTEIPENYIKVTSGLGEANPNCILIVPLKINDQVYGILELASFNKFKPHEVEFVEKIGESIASTVSNAKVNEKTKKLLEEMQQQSEEMRAQEEEMRQNMEELQATQEEMARKEKEINRLLEDSNRSEAELQRRLKDLEHFKEELELENAMFSGLMDILHDRITIKDKQGTYLRVNKTKMEALREQGILDIQDKSDRDLFGEEHFSKSFRVEKAIMDSGSAILNKEDKLVLPDGQVIWGSTSRAPFKNPKGQTLGVLVVTRDITSEKLAKEALLQAMEQLNELKQKNRPADQAVPKNHS